MLELYRAAQTGVHCIATIGGTGLPLELRPLATRDCSDLAHV